MMSLPAQTIRRTALAVFCLVSLTSGSATPPASQAERARVPGTLCSIDNSYEELSADQSSLGSPSPSLQGRAEHLSRLGISSWHTAGQLGKGVKVAVLDSGFRGYRNHLGKALPANVTARSFRFDGNLEAKESQHGILCGEVIHALAPDAELLFANWEPDHPAQFLQAVRWAREQGARVISCSVIMPSWSDGEGGGPIHEELSRILGSGKDRGDVLLFASAGNTAQRHWAGLFHAGTDGCHEWLPGQEDNILRPFSDEQVSVEVCWKTGASYEVHVYDEGTAQEIACSVAEKKDRFSTVVHFQPQAEHTYGIRVRLRQGTAGSIHVVALGSGMKCATARGSISFPADGPEVVAVGAVNFEGKRAAYSSCGPNSSRPKPDFVAPVPFASSWRDRPFAGTSAAAPQAAAVAALCWSAHLDWTPEQLRNTLQTSACDLGPKGHDCETGYGLVRLPRLDTRVAVRSLPKSANPTDKK